MSNPYWLALKRLRPHFPTSRLLEAPQQRLLLAPSLGCQPREVGLPRPRRLQPVLDLQHGAVAVRQRGEKAL